MGGGREPELKALTGLTCCPCRKQNGLGIAAAVMEEERCTVERRAHITYSEFMQHYAFLKPVILQGLTDNSKFRALCSRENLLASFGDNIVRLSTANTYSYQKGELHTLQGLPSHLKGRTDQSRLAPPSCSGPALPGICGTAAAAPGSCIPRQW